MFLLFFVLSEPSFLFWGHSIYIIHNIYFFLFILFDKHRDTTVQSLTLQPNVQDGVIIYEDSPLVS